MSEGAPLLAWRDASLLREGRALLAGVSASIAAGERIALVGPNGAGKSSLLRLATGWLAPTTGTVEVLGRPLAAWGRRAAARIVAAVGHEEDPAFPLAVEEVVALGRHPWRTRLAPAGPEDAAHVERALAATGLVGLRARKASTLSAGERRRLAIARALAQDPRVLLVDEAVAHLDLAQEARLLALLAAEARSRGRAVVAVLHDLAAAHAWADRVLLLAQGRLLAAGPPAEVLVEALLARAYEVAIETGCDARGRPWFAVAGPEPAP